MWRSPKDPDLTGFFASLRCAQNDGGDMKKGILSIIIFIFFLYLFPFTIHAQLKNKTFKTDFISFELTDQWNCAMDGSEYVCRPVKEAKKTDAIIIIAAKIPGTDDNMKAYYNYLRKPKKITNFKGQSFTSKVSLIKYKDIEATQWIDAIHLSSELPNFYTRYLSTVKNGIAILVTYSVAKSRHQLYAAELNKMISSIKVLAKPPQLASPPVMKEKEPASVITGPKTTPTPEKKPKQTIIIKE